MDFTALSEDLGAIEPAEKKLRILGLLLCRVKAPSPLETTDLLAVLVDHQRLLFAEDEFQPLVANTSHRHQGSGHARHLKDALQRDIATFHVELELTFIRHPLAVANNEALAALRAS